MPTLENISPNKSILLFDGVCNLCNSYIQFVVKRDTKQQFYFAALQSKAGQKLLSKYNVDPSFDSVVLIENDKAYTHSDVPLMVNRHLGKLWPATTSLRIFPLGLRNFFYKFTAKNRYRWFGKKESCMIPTPELAARFVS